MSICFVYFWKTEAGMKCPLDVARRCGRGDALSISGFSDGTPVGSGKLHNIVMDAIIFQTKERGFYEENTVPLPRQYLPLAYGEVYF